MESRTFSDVELVPLAIKLLEMIASEQGDIVCIPSDEISFLYSITQRMRIARICQSRLMTSSFGLCAYTVKYDRTSGLYIAVNHDFVLKSTLYVVNQIADEALRVSKGLDVDQPIVIRSPVFNEMVIAELIESQVRSLSRIRLSQVTRSGFHFVISGNK